MGSFFSRTCSFIILGLTAACRSATDVDRQDPTRCQQTYEFGNYGCAHLTVVVQWPPTPWPILYRIDVRARSTRPNFLGEVSFATPEKAVDEVPLLITRFLSGPSGAGDTLSMWISARMLDDVRPIVVGVPLPTFAADSVLHVVRFTGVGMIAPVDTVRLTARRVQ